MSVQYTDLRTIPEIVQGLRNSYNAHATKDIEYRKKQLRKLLEFFDNEHKEILDVLQRDLRKPEFESVSSDIAIARNDCILAIQELDEWMKPVKPSVDPINMGDNCQIWRDPLGVVLIIGTWNYPIQVTLTPLVGAIAGGNCVLLKPSEVALHTAQLLTEKLTRYLDPNTFQIVNGSVDCSQALLKERFDHIFYTGSTTVGKIIMEAASKNLCPVTLELGGKSPTIIDDNVDLENCARRVTWGRFMNSGQTCIAPDYILCTNSTREKLVPLISKYILEFYGQDPQKSPNYARIVSTNHWNRLNTLIDTSGGNVVIGGKSDRSDLFISPTVVINASPDSPLLKDEIFGPILPIVTVSGIDEAINYVNSREKPLALYVFSKNNKVIEKVLKNTTSGGAVANDVIVHAIVHSLPFGGVGASGMGSYHGKKTFEIFTHQKSISWKPMGLEFLNDIRYPPYTPTKSKLVYFVLMKKISTFNISRILLFIILVVFFIRHKNNRVYRASKILLGLE